MKPITRTALVAIAAAAIGTTAMAPAFAQPFGGHQMIQRIPGGETRAFRPDHGGFGMRGGLLGMFFSERGAEAIDVAAVRLTHQLDLTEEQAALLEDLRLAALDAQADVAEVREEFAPADDETAEPDLVARYAGLVAMTTARAEALEAVQPAFEAFVASLDDTQLETFTPQRPDHLRPSAPAAPEAEG